MYSGPEISNRNLTENGYAQRFDAKFYKSKRCPFYGNVVCCQLSVVSSRFSRRSICQFFDGKEKSEREMTSLKTCQAVYDGYET